MTHHFKGKHILHGGQFSRQDLEEIMEVARGLEEKAEAQQIPPLMKGKILATLFFEPSTRTRLSFEAAMHRLQGDVISVASAQTSSAAKGETIADTARTVSQYADVIVIRHPKIGSAKEAAEAASVPVLNAGDGAGQHPTQALLDVYTIQKELGSLEGITVSLVGDLKYGRTVHALVELLSLYPVKLVFVSPENLKMPVEITEKLRQKGVQVTETDNLGEALAASDLLYVTRIQKERFSDLSEYEKIKGTYVISDRLLREAKKEPTIMHPLPRVDEITTDVDAHPGAAYFRQVRNGIFVRMALLAMVTGAA
ncbi:MAG: aspartate carbamoyltransferase [Deltaproteobacteria bacterium]|nr:aspartate carbamoyltransferase [Deltaproteobacteria bacterium]MBW2121271.1 aspartate carbamoyltransferase [Deltaproteobacteria bacterium]